MDGSFGIVRTLRTLGTLRSLRNYSSLVQLVLSMRIRVRQLKRTELAWRVESAQCLRSPHSLTKFVGTP